MLAKVTKRALAELLGEKVEEEEEEEELDAIIMEEVDEFGHVVEQGNSTLDNFIEDDAVVMFKIMREEFLNIVMLYSFNKEEFDEIVSATIGNPEMSKVLQAMYQSGTPKDYADAFINAEVQSVLSKREKITRDKIEQGMQLLLEDKTVA